MKNKETIIQLIGAYLNLITNPSHDYTDVERQDRLRAENHKKICEEYAKMFNVEPSRIKKEDINIDAIINNEQWKNIDELIKDIGGYQRLIDYIFYHFYDYYSDRFENSRSVIKTNYSWFFSIDHRIDRIEKAIKERFDPCEKLRIEFEEKRRKYHENIDYDDERYIYSSHSHDMAGYSYSIRCALNQIKEFAKLPVESYTSAAYSIYVDDNVKKIYSNIEKSESIAWRILKLMEKHPELNEY